MIRQTRQFMRKKPRQPVPLHSRQPFGERAAMFVLAAVFCLAGIAQQSTSGQTTQREQQAVVGQPITPAVCAARTRQAPSRGAEGTRSLIALLSFHEKQRAVENDDSGPSAAVLRGAELYAGPLRTDCSRFITHDVSECARRGMRTSGRHPPH